MDYSRFSGACAEKVERIIIIIIMIVAGNFVLEFFLEQTILGNFWFRAPDCAMGTCVYCKVLRNVL
jgi:hypothetical protein